MATIRAPKRDLGRPQPERVAVAGVPLVVVEDDRHRVLERGGLLEDHLADPGVLDDAPPLGAGQRGRLVEDLRRDGHLADVVEQRRDPDPVDLGSGSWSDRAIDDHDRRDQRRRLAAVMGERRDDRRQEVGRRLARLPADLDRARPPAAEIGARGTRASSSGSAKM